MLAVAPAALDLPGSVAASGADAAAEATASAPGAAQQNCSCDHNLEAILEARSFSTRLSPAAVEPPPGLVATGAVEAEIQQTQQLQQQHMTVAEQRRQVHVVDMRSGTTRCWCCSFYYSSPTAATHSAASPVADVVATLAAAARRITAESRLWRVRNCCRCWRPEDNCCWHSPGGCFRAACVATAVASGGNPGAAGDSSGAAVPAWDTATGATATAAASSSKWHGQQGKALNTAPGTRREELEPPFVPRGAAAARPMMRFQFFLLLLLQLVHLLLRPGGANVDGVKRLVL
ncbi:hypothetical protein EBH_0051960 [Eimeria brunetti]|uniref:Uncharacterized protein n=1 Tax=Eimeria brunetti TaxID=51314 RepID=U6LVX0_9EIME|nr:hypothetical protein EBH_0051960 [Eimeria brunetti]